MRASQDSIKEHASVGLTAKFCSLAGESLTEYLKLELDSEGWNRMGQASKSNDSIVLSAQIHVRDLGEIQVVLTDNVDSKARARIIKLRVLKFRFVGFFSVSFFHTISHC